MNNIKMHIKVEVKLTEDHLKVRKAIENLFGKIKLDYEQKEKNLTLKAIVNSKDPLDHFYQLLKRERIRDAARSILYQSLNVSGQKKLIFYLNKQVAYAGHISFCEPSGESPLEPIEVTVVSEKPRKLVQWLTRKQQ